MQVIYLENFGIEPIQIVQQMFYVLQLFFVVHLLVAVGHRTQSIEGIFESQMLLPFLVLVVKACGLGEVADFNPSNDVPKQLAPLAHRLVLVVFAFEDSQGYVIHQVFSVFRFYIYAGDCDYFFVVLRPKFMYAGHSRGLAS
jgi:hypothetical protein